MSALVNQNNANSNGYVASLVVTSVKGRLFGMTGYNSKTSAQFIQVHDSAGLPADAAVPVITFTVPAASNFSWDSNPNGRAFLNGIVVCNSSTGPTKTIGSADVLFDVQWTP